METRVTATFGSSGRAASIVATGTETEIRTWAAKKEKQNYTVTINAPSGQRTEWQANAMSCDNESRRAYGTTGNLR